MQTGTLPEASNRATWSGEIAIYDDETDELVDLSALDEITLAVRDLSTRTIMLTGTLSGGQITIIETGIFAFTFTKGQMGALDVTRTYEVGITIEEDDEDVQILIGYLPLLDGIVL